MKQLFALLVLFLIFQIVLNSNLLSSANKKLLQALTKLNTISNGQSLTSLNKGYYAKVQDDGKFAIYSTGNFNGSGSDKLIWAASTVMGGAAPYLLKMQEDGNLVLSDARNSVIWSSGVYNVGKAPYMVVMQDNGSLVVYDSTPAAIWQSPL